MVKQVGDGAYGTVYKAVDTSTGEVVAIKKIKRKFDTWEECMSQREVRVLRKLSHPNIVRLREVHRVNGELCFVFEYLDKNLFQLINSRAKSLPEMEIKHLVYQVLQGLAYMHRQGFFHRDLKPENLMVSSLTGTVKIADFGLVREVRSRPPFTDYVSTRWYRAPEVILHSSNYNSPVDIFALGAVMAELYLMRPLFPGNNEHDQMAKICSVLGTPRMSDWPEGHRLAVQTSFVFPTFLPVPLSGIIRDASTLGIDLMERMMSFDPTRRPSAGECLRHHYFDEVRTDCDSPVPACIKPVRHSRSKHAPKQSSFPGEERESKLAAIAAIMGPVSTKTKNFSPCEDYIMTRFYGFQPAHDVKRPPIDCSVALSNLQKLMGTSRRSPPLQITKKQGPSRPMGKAKGATPPRGTVMRLPRLDSAEWCFPRETDLHRPEIY